MFRISSAQGKAALLLALLFLCTGLWMVGRQRNNQDREGLDETENPSEAWKQEFEKTRDPQLNTVPRERLIAALEYYTRSSAALAKTTTTFSNIVWTERGPDNIGGRTRALLFDLNDATHKTVFAAGVGGGLWKCTDITVASPIWSVVNDQFANLAITTIAQNPANPQIMYFGTGEGFHNSDAIRGNGIWKSTNGGSTWTQLSATAGNDDFSYVQKIIVTGTGHVYAACKGASECNAGGLQKSADGGTSWTRVIGSTAGCLNLNTTDVELASNGDIYATAGIFTTGRIFKSSAATYGVNVGNAGNWADITPAGSFHRIEIALAPNNSSKVYALCQSSSSYDVSDIFSSSNGGGSWSNQTVPIIYDQGNYPVFTRSQAWYDLTCAVDPNNSQTVYIGGVDILKSTDGGSNWTQLTSWSLYDDGSLFPFPWSSDQNVHADIQAFVFKPGTSTTALVGCDGGLFYSTNLTTAAGLPAWANKNTGYNVTQYYSCAAHPTNANYYLAGAQDNGSHKFTAAGLNSGDEVTGGDGAFCFINQSNSNRQITSYVYNNFFRSTDGGASFNDIAGGDNTGRFINPCDLDNSNNILYSASDNDELARWKNVFTGVNRTNLSISIGNTKASAVKVSPNTPSTVYVGTNQGNVYRITSANNSSYATALLTPSPLVPGGYVSSIDIVKRATNTDDSIVVTFSNYGVLSVWFTSNGTAASPTWTTLDDQSTLQDMPVRWALFSPVNSHILFLGTEAGVLATDGIAGAATSWTMVNNNTLPNVRVDMLKVNANDELVAATHGRGLWTSVSIAPLRLRLISFDARLQSKKVSLQWEVNNDQEAKSYTLERMYAGQQSFEPFRTIPASGQVLYREEDGWYDGSKGPVSYRLKCKDKKGDLLYSEVRTIRTGAAPDFIRQVYPTPSTGMVFIQTGSAAMNQMRVQLFDAVGRLKMDKLMPYASGALHLQELARGTYTLLITAPGGSEKYSSRIVLQ